MLLKSGSIVCFVYWKRVFRLPASVPQRKLFDEQRVSVVRGKRTVGDSCSVYKGMQLGSLGMDGLVDFVNHEAEICAGKTRGYAPMTSDAKQATHTELVHLPFTHHLSPIILRNYSQ